jgi:general stress protein YciG
MTAIERTSGQTEGTANAPAEPSVGASPSNAKPASRRRGFAAMDRNLVSDIARKGGKAAHAAGTAHEFTPEEARLAGGKGGRATHANRRRLAETSGPESHPGGSGAHS